MIETTLVTYLYDILYGAAIFAVPPLLISTIVAFIIGLFQAVTQISEQTLPQTVKIIIIGVILLFFGATLVGPLFSVSERIFSDFYMLII